jgi:hypothetical protein
MKTQNLFLLALSMLCLSSCGSCYRQYSREQDMHDAEYSGKARLLEAESSKRIQIEDAKGQEEASLLRAKARVTIAKAQAEAEIERAKGVAEANKIIGESLKGNEAYLRYLWITGLHDGKGERIYIPTEAGLPLLEAK